MSESENHAGHWRRIIRNALILFRLLSLFILFIWLLYQIDLQRYSLRQAGFQLNSVYTAPLDLPFVGSTVSLASMRPTSRQAALTRLAESNIGWVRQRFDWGALEPSPGDFDWAQTDQILAAITRAGLTPVVVLDGSPAWARADVDIGPADNPEAPPADPSTFANFAAKFARRYGDQVRYYQIWHEPNIAPHWGNRHIEPVHYGQLLIEASRAIRAVDEDAVIVTAALAPTTDQGHTAIDEVTFLNRLYAVGIQPYVDMVAIEPFGFAYRADDARHRRDLLNFQRAAWVRRAMLNAGDGQTPLLAARFGWNRQSTSPWPTVIPDNQQQFLIDSLDIGWSDWPWLAGMGWAIDQPADDERILMSGYTLNDELLAKIGNWVPSERRPRGSPGIQFPWLLAVLSGCIALVIWRGSVAMRLLPWQRWRDGYLHQPVWLRIALWIVLLVLYYTATWPPLIVLWITFAAVLVAVQPPAGVWLAALLLPFTFQHKELHLVTSTLLITPVQAVILASLPALAIRATSLRGRFSLQPLDWFGLSWLVLSLSAGLNVWHWPGYVDGLMDLVLTPLLLYTMLRLFIADHSQRLYTALALFAGGLFVAGFGLVDWFWGGGTEADAIRRLVGPYFSPNHAALYLERTLFLGLGIWLVTSDQPLTWRSSRRQSWMIPVATAAAIAVVVLALLLTASRGALLLGVPAGLILFSWLAKGDQIQFFTWKNGFLAVLLISACIVVGTLFWPRLSNTATLAERKDIWMATVRLWQEAPIVGVGPGGFYWRYPAFIPTGTLLDPNLRHPHSLWLETTAMWGLAGLAWLLSLLIWVVRRCWSERSVLRRCQGCGIAIGLLAGLFAGLAHGQVDAFAVLADIAGWNWLALGLWRAVAKPRIDKRII